MALELLQTASVEEQWHTVVAPWLQAHATEAWREARATVVLTPGRAESFYLRGRWMDEGHSFLGLRFWTPSDARTFLLGQIDGIQPVSPAEQKLLARVAAQKLLDLSDHADPSLTSVAREPGPFLRAYDLLLGAGWEPAREGPPYSRQLAREMGALLQEQGTATQAGVHRELFRQFSSRPSASLAHLLIIGFNANHWPLWDLLRATIAAASATTMGLQAPGIFGEEVDQLWISSWEGGGDATVQIPAGESIPETAPFNSWISAYEQGRPGSIVAGELSFLAAPDLATQIDAVVLQTLAYLKDDSCRRMGIIFAEPDALALGVAHQLRQLGIPLDDGTGFIQPGLFERASWQTWLLLQEEPSVQRLITWVRACEAEGVSFGGESGSPSAREIARALDEALGESLVDHLYFLAEQLQESGHDRAVGVAAFLRARRKLPESGTFADYLSVTCHALDEFGWKSHSARVASLAPAWLGEMKWILPRATFLKWLKDAGDSRERTRGADGNHFYGKVHLLIYAQMPGQTWTHLILTGLNDGRWPRLFEAGAFGSRYELAELNRQARSLNRRGQVEGSQGAGHEVVWGGRGHCLLPLERQDLALRDLCAAVEATSSSVCLAALTAEGGRALLPSDFFNHAYQAKTGIVLEETGFRALARSTVEWCQAQSKRLRPELKGDDESEIASTQIAYAARRDASQRFGKYEFAFAQPPRQPIQLSCKTWEAAWSHPASVWLEKIVGLQPWPEGQLAWPRAVGTWVHRWLKIALRACREDKQVGQFLLRLRDAADREPDFIQKRAGRVGVELHPWWRHVWGQARAVSLGLADSLAPLLEDRDFLSEYQLPNSRPAALPGATQADFGLKGRIDLLLVEPGASPFDPTSGQFADCSCWVVDFKTGAASPLTVARMDKGIGLQAMLYALAIRASGAASVAASIHTFDSSLKPQVQIEQIEAGTALFRSLDRLHRQGIFGMRPAPDGDYSFAPTYPLATRPIPATTLQAKWALTHGAAFFMEEG